MRRILIALGLLAVLTGLLLCWPLARLWATHERGDAKVLDVFTRPLPDGEVALRVLWELQTSPGTWIVGDAQSDRFFRPISDPSIPADESAEIAGRLLPDRSGRYRPVKAFWRANDPLSTAFILDVSSTHPLRRYIVGLAFCAAGLVTIRLAWAYAGRRRA